jgi:hypothetical protein
MRYEARRRYEQAGIMYESVIMTPTTDIYDKHQFLDRQFKIHGIEVKRDYTWAVLPGVRKVVLRYHQPLDWAPWTILEVPPEGARVRFRLCSNIRRLAGNAEISKRLTDQDYCRNLDWLEYTSKKTIGWDLLDDSIDVQHLAFPLRRLCDPDHSFTLRASQFEGIATIRDQKQFARALTFGVGNGKAFGLGFVFFSMLRSRPDVRPNVY